MADRTIDRTKDTLLWQLMLITGGVVALAAGAVLEVVLLSYHSTSTVLKTGNTTVTTTGPAAPSASLVTMCVGAGVLLILAAAFFGRIGKVVLPGGYEVDLDDAAKIAGMSAEKAQGDPVKTANIYKRAASRAAGLAAGAVPRTTRVSSFARKELRAAAPLTDRTIQGLVDDAAMEEEHHLG